MRHFVSPEEFTEVNNSMRIIRKSDGTKFFILSPDNSSVGSTLQAGIYRITMRYRRDKSTRASESALKTSR